MASRDITVTVGEEDWFTLEGAAEHAGMSVEAYVSWGVRILAMQSRPGGAKQDRTAASPKATRRAVETAEESESAAWTETFSERLSQRADRYDHD
ncbi:hypothetical protein [Nocardia sp. NBC_00511]|uniref:hypothetical protein n=1 Tax=Nocardia sp. NBC_00511 TaxID=2903591 RepID=UPI0030E50EC8